MDKETETVNRMRERHRQGERERGTTRTDPYRVLTGHTQQIEVVSIILGLVGWGGVGFGRQGMRVMLLSV